MQSGPISVACDELRSRPSARASGPPWASRRSSPTSGWRRTAYALSDAGSGVDLHLLTRARANQAGVSSTGGAGEHLRSTPPRTHVRSRPARTEGRYRGRALDADPYWLWDRTHRWTRNTGALASESRQFGVYRRFSRDWSLPSPRLPGQPHGPRDPRRSGRSPGRNGIGPAMVTCMRSLHYRPRGWSSHGFRFSGSWCVTHQNPSVSR